MSASLPVLCYHSVGPRSRIPPELFALHLEVLARSGLPSLSPGELERARRGFLLTFDDGFADLWTHGLALLERFGVRAVVFAIPLRTGEGVARPRGVPAWGGTASEAHGEAAASGGPHPAFLRWSELAALEATGVVTVHSHSYSHAMGWVGDRILGFNLGAAHWSVPEATGGDRRLGIPLYARGSALAHRLYRDDPNVRDGLAEWLARRGGAAYVRERGGKAVARELAGEARRLRRSAGTDGAWESEEERERRVTEEIVRARSALEERLGGRRDELCLPWGEYDQVTLDCARRVGIRRVYTLGGGPNPAGAVGLLVHRFEPRGKGPLWLRSRLRIYGSTLASRLYVDFFRYRTVSSGRGGAR